MAKKVPRLVNEHPCLYRSLEIVISYTFLLLLHSNCIWPRADITGCCRQISYSSENLEQATKHTGISKSERLDIFSRSFLPKIQQDKLLLARDLK